MEETLPCNKGKEEKTKEEKRRNFFATKVGIQNYPPTHTHPQHTHTHTHTHTQVPYFLIN
jgi:hypothetical protein